MKLSKQMHCESKGCWVSQEQCNKQGLHGMAQALWAPHSSFLLEFLLHLFYFWCFITQRSHVKIKNCEIGLNGSKALFLNCFRGFYSSAVRCNCSAEIWNSLMGVVQVSCSFKQNRFSKATPCFQSLRWDMTWWNKILLLLETSKCSSFSDFFFKVSLSGINSFSSTLSLKN